MKRTAVAFVVGLVVGVVVAVGMMSMFGAGRGELRLLDNDMDLEKSYFFRPDLPPPVRGTILSGSKVQVRMLKGGAAYVSLETVLDRQTLMDQSRAMEER